MDLLGNSKPNTGTSALNINMKLLMFTDPQAGSFISTSIDSSSFTKDRISYDFRLNLVFSMCSR